MTPSILREKVHLLAMREWSLTDFTPIRGAFGGRTDPRSGTNFAKLEVYGLFMYKEERLQELLPYATRREVVVAVRR